MLCDWRTEKEKGGGVGGGMMYHQYTPRRRAASASLHKHTPLQLAWPGNKGQSDTEEPSRLRSWQRNEGGGARRRSTSAIIGRILFMYPSLLRWLFHNILQTNTNNECILCLCFHFVSHFHFLWCHRDVVHHCCWLCCKQTQAQPTLITLQSKPKTLHQLKTVLLPRPSWRNDD